MKNVSYIDNKIDNISNIDKDRFNNYRIEYNKFGKVYYLCRKAKGCDMFTPYIIQYSYTEGFIYYISYINYNNNYNNISTYKTYFVRDIIINYYFNDKLVYVFNHKDYDKYVRLQNIS